MIPVSQPSLGPSELRLVTETLTANRLTQGPMVQRFEQQLATFLGTRNVVAVNNGTAALHLVLAALGIGPGDEVLVPDLTFVATANAVAYTGALPVLVDADPITWCIDLEDADRKITDRTRAIVPVHLYGVPCDMESIDGLGLMVIEDAAEGLGGYIGGKALGTWGLAGTFSFFGNKIITTGEGGAIATDDDELAARLRLLRGQGQSPDRRYFHTELGFNYRMTDLQAALGVGQLEWIVEKLDRRAQVIQRYVDELPLTYGWQTYSDHYVAAPWMFTCLLPMHVDRDSVAVLLAADGIETRPAFVPLHQMPMYRLQTPTEDSVADVIGEHGLSLPTYPDLSLENVSWIARRLVAAVDAAGTW